MLPNHSPLVIAEQFGTLAALHPGPDRPRPRAGAGHRPAHAATRCAATRRRGTLPAGRDRAAGLPRRREPGSRACRRSPAQGTHVPLYILGSSLFGAQLAAALGLPYAFASHFAPDALHEAVAHLPRAVPTVRAARRAVRHRRRQRDRRRHRAEAQRAARARPAALVRGLFGRPGAALTDEEVDAILRSPQGAQVDQMLTYTAVGTPDDGRDVPRRVPRSTPTPTS